MNIRYNPIPDLSLRASYSEGFRAPQTYDEDLHVAAVGGEVTLIQVAKDLKTERSRSYSASVDYYTTWGPVQINLLLEGFYTSLHNPFVLEEIESDDENKILERRNGSDAVVKDLTLKAKSPHTNPYNYNSGQPCKVVNTINLSRGAKTPKWKPVANCCVPPTNTATPR